MNNTGSSDGSEQRTLIPEAQRVLQQGHGRPIWAQKVNGVWFVEVGGQLYPSTKWKTFHDFLGSYIKIILGGQWANEDLKRPRAERHPLMNWYEDFTHYLRKHIQTTGVPAPMQMTSLRLRISDWRTTFTCWRITTEKFRNA